MRYQFLHFKRYKLKRDLRSCVTDWIHTETDAGCQLRGLHLPEGPCGAAASPLPCTAPQSSHRAARSHRCPRRPLPGLLLRRAVGLPWQAAGSVAGPGRWHGGWRTSGHYVAAISSPPRPCSGVQQQKGTEVLEQALRMMKEPQHRCWGAGLRGSGLFSLGKRRTRETSERPAGA